MKPFWIMCLALLMLWFVYPAAGMLFAEILKNVQDRDRFYKRTLALCVAVIISLVSFLPLTDYDIRNTYALSYLVFHGLENTMIGRFIRYCSVNLTTICVIQWLLIIYGFLFMMIIGSGLISLEAVIPTGLIITAASIGLSVLWNRVCKNHNGC